MKRNIRIRVSAGQARGKKGCDPPKKAAFQMETSSLK
jgi:hypothetical protein